MSYPEHSQAELNNDPKDENSEFTRAVTLALYDYLRKSKSRGFVLSLSGGADSSTCAVLVAEMVRRGVNELGPEKFLSQAGLSEVVGLEDESELGSTNFE